MRIVAKTKEFKKALNIGGQFAGKNKMIPALTNVKIATKGNRFKIESSDFRNFCRKFGNVQSCDQDGSFLVDYASLNGYIGLVPSEEFTMYIDSQTNTMIIKHDNGQFSLPVSEPMTFPEFTTADSMNKVVIDADVFGEWLNISQLYASRDEFRPQMSGMHLFVKDGNIGFCATDAHTLGTDSIRYHGGHIEDFGITIDVSSLRAIQQLLKMENDTDNFSIEFSDKNAFVKVGTSTVGCRLVEGQFPNFRAVIPDNNDKVVRFKREDMAYALRRTSMAASTTYLCKLRIEPAGIYVSMEDLDFSKKTVDKVDADADFSLEIGVNWQKLLLVLEGLNTETVICKLADSTRPLVFHEDNKVSQKTILVMPMLLSSN